MPYQIKGIIRKNKVQLSDASGKLILKEINNSKAIELRAISLHAVDLDFCDYCVNELFKIDCEKQSDLAEAFWIACITRFFKCFGSSKSRIKLSAGDIFGNTKHSNSFEFFKALRNKHITHDENPFSDSHVILELDAIDQEKTLVEVHASPIHLFIIEKGEIERLQNLVKIASNWVKSRRLDLESELSSDCSQWPRRKLDSLPSVEISAPSFDDVFKKRNARMESKDESNDG